MILPSAQCTFQAFREGAIVDDRPCACHAQVDNSIATAVLALSPLPALGDLGTASQRGPANDRTGGVTARADAARRERLRCFTFNRPHDLMDFCPAGFPPMRGPAGTLKPRHAHPAPAAQRAGMSFLATEPLGQGPNSADIASLYVTGSAQAQIGPVPDFLVPDGQVGP